MCCCCPCHCAPPYEPPRYDHEMVAFWNAVSAQMPPFPSMPAYDGPLPEIRFGWEEYER